MRLLLAIAFLTACAPSRGSSSSFGEEATTLLSEPASVVVVPVMGRVPHGDAVALVERRLSENGSGVASVTTRANKIDARRHWDDEALRSVTPNVDRGTLVLVYVPGTYLTVPSALAVTFGPHSVAVFKDTVVDHGREARALLHEVGHVLGLVQGPRADALHPRHDVDSRCVMFWFDPTGDDFCDACKFDLSVQKR